MLALENTALLVIDVQGKLAHLMNEKETLFNNLQKLIKGAQVLELPILWTEQRPEKIGPTISEVARLLPNIKLISKMSFSCCGNEKFMQEIKDLGRKQILIAGIETHVCVYQTAMDLVNLGYEVQVITDAVSSRTPQNKEIGFERIKAVGASLTGTETALFELLKVGEGTKFKEILGVIK